MTLKHCIITFRIRTTSITTLRISILRIKEVIFMLFKNKLIESSSEKADRFKKKLGPML